MRVLGVDPGSNRVGFGIIEDKKGALEIIEYGIIEIPPHTNTHARIVGVGEGFSELLERTKPDRAGIETLFFSKNKKTAMAVSEMRGVLLFLLLTQNIPVYEYSPTTVKSTVTGYGLADKAAVMKMVKKILGVGEIIKYDDAADALAIAITATMHPNR